MNFLAHCLIAARVPVGNASSRPNDWRTKAKGTPNGHESLSVGLIAGGVLGDFIKGPIPPQLPAPLRAGVRLHRRIDAYSNQLAGVRQSCGRFPKNLRRLAPVFVDIIADHCLALDWQMWHGGPLEEFSQRCYAALTPHAHYLDDRSRRYLNWLIEEDLLASYRTSSSMERGLKSVTRQLRREHLNSAVLEFVAEALPELRADFRAYFPQLLEHGRDWIESRISTNG